MSSSLKNLSGFDDKNIPSAESFRFGIVVSEWNEQVTGRLLEGAQQSLLRFNAKKENIQVIYVPGSFELTSGALKFCESKQFDAIICLGCIIQGETKHFDFISQAVAGGITELNIHYKIPVIFGVLTTNDLSQALERSGGRHGNKGDEAAITAIKMAALWQMS